MTTLVPLFLIGSSSFLQATRTTIKSRMSSRFGKVRPRSAELAALGLSFYCNNLDPLPPKPKFTLKGIQEFHRRFVLASADKAANNAVVV